jgi:hypothetical protein
MSSHIFGSYQTDYIVTFPIFHQEVSNKRPAVAALIPHKNRKEKEKKNMNEAKKLTSTRRSVAPPLGCYENPEKYEFFEFFLKRIERQC